MTDVNLAPINDGLWIDDMTWASVPSGHYFYETNPANQHNGALTWRQEPGAYAIEHKWQTLSFNIGDHVIMSCWIKTLGTPVYNSGADLGFDLYNSNYEGTWKRIVGINNPDLLANLGNIDINGPDTGWGDTISWLVPWGSDWKYKAYDFIVASSYYSDGAFWSDADKTHQVIPRGAWAPATNICPFVYSIVNGSYLPYPYTCWVSDFQLKVNPTSTTKRRLTISKVLL
jgi:hypothetical protein